MKELSISQAISSETNKGFKDTSPSVKTTEIFGKAILKAIIFLR